MKYSVPTCFILIGFFVFPVLTYSQLLDSAALQTQPVYHHLDSALLHPEKVIRLDLSRKKLTAFPKEILLLKNLQELNLSKNRIDSLPEQIKQLIHLQYLNLSGNRLKYLPDSIGALTQLVILIASRNNLLEIPKGIGGLVHLEVLDLWENDIGFFPNELSKLKKLKRFDLRVILIDDATQQKIKLLLPHSKIFFSPSCHCVTG
jgi:Leucine-rich repeat (LRR) protein